MEGRSGYGVLDPEWGPYLPHLPLPNSWYPFGTTDWAGDIEQYVIEATKVMKSEECLAIISKMIELSKNLLDNRIEYNPLGPNSNSYAYWLFQRIIGGKLPIPPKEIGLTGVTGRETKVPFEPFKPVPPPREESAAKVGTSYLGRKP